MKSIIAAVVALFFVGIAWLISWATGIEYSSAASSVALGLCAWLFVEAAHD